MLLLMCFLLPSSYGKFHGVYTCYNAKAHLPSNKRTVPTAWLMFEQRHDNKVQQLQVHTPINGVLRLNFQHMEEERQRRLPTQHQAIFRHQQGILQFNLILALSTQRQRQLSQVVGSVLPGCSHHFTYQSKP